MGGGTDYTRAGPTNSSGGGGDSGPEFFKGGGGVRAQGYYIRVIFIY